MLRDEISLPEKIPRTQLYLPTQQEGVEEFFQKSKGLLEILGSEA
jgi:hypothetical protein